jgi:predicted DNA-binding transcriptional regulator AlpA
MNVKMPLPPGALDTGQMAARYSCSRSQIKRLCDAGLMPGPIRLGSLPRWIVSELEQWEAKGCPPVRQQQQKPAA